ncbi:hypothetical protein GW17_00028458 [Ensete ventricosum]|nr:hypothetical protein GW17_00028458 [Ensete ventricosum]
MREPKWKLRSHDDDGHPPTVRSSPQAKRQSEKEDRLSSLKKEGKRNCSIPPFSATTSCLPSFPCDSCCCHRSLLESNPSSLSLSLKVFGVVTKQAQWTSLVMPNVGKQGCRLDDGESLRREATAGTVAVSNGVADKVERGGTGKHDGRMWREGLLLVVMDGQSVDSPTNHGGG